MRPLPRPGRGRADLARLGALAVFASALVAVMLPLPLVAGGGRPAWVDRFPRDPEVYAGIGRADKRKHPDTYRDLARDAALAQISREISVEVASTAVSARSEDAAGPEESFSARTITLSRNSLAGYRLEGVHETPDEFWAYYALDKETFRAALDAKEKRLAAWMEAEAASLSGDLDARRLQAAADRYARLLAAYATEFSGDPLLKSRASPLPAAMDSMSATFAAAMRGLRLESVPARWEFTAYAEPGAPGSAAVPPRVSLIDGAGGKWAGPFSLILSDRFGPKFLPDRLGRESASCRMDTDAEGLLAPDPEWAFLACGLEPGRWSVSWLGPEGHAARTYVESILRKRDLGLVVSAAGDGADPAGKSMAKRAAEDLGRALVGTQGRFHRIVGGNAFPVVEIQIREAALDSLEGFFFATLRADALFPDSPGPVAVRGKAGHADKSRAWARAEGDFARALNALALTGH